VPQLQEAFGTWAYKSGIRKIYSMVSDFGPGHDAERAFQKAFKAAGGEIIASVRFPVGNPDFSAFVQAAKDKNPESMFIWVPGGAQPAAIAKALSERGIDPKKTKILGQGELTEDEARQRMGDTGLGIITVYHYDHNHDSALNREFVKAFKAEYGGRNPNIYSIGGWDGIHLIYEALKKTGGKADGESLIAAARGMKWESPRGPISIDPETRDIVQTVYIRRVEKAGPGASMGTLNVEFDKIADVKDPPR
jgi:branched-chain amino acid transport system substrate-binding protein